MSIEKPGENFPETESPRPNFLRSIDNVTHNLKPTVITSLVLASLAGAAGLLVGVRLFKYIKEKFQRPSK